ncbi:hypothetical protein EDD36DRAFT_43572 [Exophiala viscosa]|uniref:SMP-30/Gluconolactonase/LRE-like region domain-containing protein n=1 Tax=Exophiala viscosa TaxID=2486360 RepID=A0AAN6E8U9_9EURO|nr:hypothetical protein EDD36DRAFT_43572 [Exophiala viscosa]
MHGPITQRFVLTGFLTTVIAAIAATAQSSNATANNVIVSIPPSDTVVLPATFSSNYSLRFVDTVIPPSSPVDTLLASAENATFISYSQDFLDILGPSPSARRIAGPLEAEFAYEAGAYDPELNSVWFTGSDPTESSLTSYESVRIVLNINLTSYEVSVPNLTAPVLVANGGIYHDGKIYICHWGNYTYAGGIVAIDPESGNTTTVVNSYFGLRLNGPDDMAWTTGPDNTSDPVMFFSDVDYSALLNFTGPAQLPNAIWRFNPTLNSLQPVISRAEINSPNGIAVSPDGKRLYVTDSPVSNLQGSGPGNTTGSAAVFVWDLDDTVTPVSKRMFSLARTGIPDGIKVDRSGRVWTAETEGIMCRDATGRLLGFINAKVLDSTAVPIANFALAGNKIIVLAVNQIWEVEVAEELSWIQ